jgi:hypothetical protein
VKWIRLTPERAQSLYGVPTELATAAENIFFDMPIELPREYDVPRPLLAIIQDEKHRNIVTLHIKTIHPETWEYQGMLPNPLSVDIGGYLSLDQESLSDLIAILSTYQEQHFDMSNENRIAFEKIQDLRLKDFRFHPEWLPNTKQNHYIQVYDPLKRNNDDSVVTILILSKSVGFSNTHFKISQFPSQALQDPRFMPLYQGGRSRIDLDRNSMQELIALLRAQISA